MDKYGVDETEQTEKTGQEKRIETCPCCGATIEHHGKIRVCPRCGTKPFEGEGE